jgi:hypothetical protein
MVQNTSTDVEFFGLEISLWQVVLEEAVAQPPLSIHCSPSLIRGYDSGVRQATQDRYHWSRLALPFHPAEPDVFGALLLVQSAVTNSDQSLMEVVDGLPLAPETHMLLKGVLRLYS